MAHHVIYIPGLGDSRSYGQDKAVANWQKFGLRTHYYPLGWADKEKFAPKLARLLGKIDGHVSQGHKVSLVGASAGASAVLNAYAKRPELNAVICIGGKINNPQSIGRRIYSINPAFKEAVFSVSAALQKITPENRRRILSIHPLFDGTVPAADTHIPGAVEKTVPVIGHRLGIFYSIVFGARAIAGFIKDSKAKR